MNSEELEKSLKTEFESHLNDVLAEMRQELDGFQEKFETEIESHKTRLSEVLKDFSSRLNTSGEIDEVFRESVVEHLRLARDEGARITAEAITEAEQMEKESAPAVSFNELRDAINEISSQSSQAEILKSLVNHAAQYVPRGAFFIVKNEHFVGWRVFGKEADMDDKAVREVYFPISAATVLGESVRSLATVESSYGTYDDDAFYLEKLDFGQPDRMYALPLLARGRGVAVLYADYGHEGTSVNIEALETMMRVAGLTVELLAASRGAKNRPDENVQTAEASQMDYSEPQTSPSFAATAPVEETSSDDFGTENEPAEEYSYEQPQTESYGNYQFESKPADEFETADSSYAESREEESVEEKSYEYQTQTPVNEYQFETEKPADETEEKEDTASTYDYSTPSYNYSETPAEESSPTYSIEEETAEEPQTVEEESDWNKTVETNGYSYNYSAEKTDNYSAEKTEEEPPSYEPVTSPNDYHIPATNSYEFETSKAEETPSYEIETNETVSSPYENSSYEQEAQPAAQEEYSAPKTENSYSYESPAETKEPAYAEPVETVSQSVISQPSKTRFSERNVDLPIDVAEDERRLHNDARRFARLLVSEIKLYNEQKVNEGRTSYDLYERLREAIDRSREMYDKRVQPPVAAKFDYFHYELVNSLAEGDEARLGGSYPGATV